MKCGNYKLKDTSFVGGRGYFTCKLIFFSEIQRFHEIFPTKFEGRGQNESGFMREREWFSGGER